MATGYEKILALIDKKNEKVVSEVSPRINNGFYSINSETSLKPRGFQAAGPEVSGGQATSPSLPDEAPDWIEEIIDLTVTGQLTEAVPVSVKPDYQHILGEGVWFCPDLTTAEGKTPDLAFTSEELPIIIPLIIENKELASTLVSAKRIFGGTIIDSSLLDLPPAEHHDGQAGAEDRPEPGEDAPLDQDTSHHQDGGGTPSPRKGLPSRGRHLVIIRTVKAYLQNFPEYTGPRARIVMAIMDGPDAGKIIVDNVSLPHPEESKGMLQRRVRLACRLGLVAWGTQGTVQINWKSLQGLFCRVDLVYKNLGGGEFLTVGNYELIEYGAHTQPAHPLPLAGVEGEHVIDEHPPVNPTEKEHVLVDGTCFFVDRGDD
ncbi:MAG: hypothetical protein L6277_04765 [Desulfobacterales bacterium]|nr:hypothetical protein [Pseudomonadota bacterium]MBU4353979.1 hypothetical protein [Pseudomonadota bacterium]MCG2771385.1 hypothetical protein [Desulfobacterales bacterium]